MFKDFNMLINNILLFFIARALVYLILIGIVIAAIAFVYRDGGDHICYVDQVGLFGKVSKSPTSCSNLYHENVFK